MLLPIAAGLLAAAVSYAANRFLVRVFGNTALAVSVPLGEETAKTLFALLLGAGIVSSHLVFGLAEAALEWHIRKSGVLAALSAVVSHTVFGLLAGMAYSRTGVPVYGIVAAFIPHAAVNTLLLFRAAKR